MVQTPNIKLEKPAEGTRPWTTAVNGNWDKIDAAVGNIKLVPVGSMIPYAADTPPEGWLVCDGSAVGRTDYAELFALIGTKYGSGNNSTTFNLPNFINRTFWGGTSSGTIKEAGLPNIIGNCKPVFGVIGSYSGAITYTGTKKFVFSTVGGSLHSADGSLYFNASHSSKIYGKSTTVQPAALQTLIIIKY